jgi:hypothetical protein
MCRSHPLPPSTAAVPFLLSACPTTFSKRRRRGPTMLLRLHEVAHDALEDAAVAPRQGRGGRSWARTRRPLLGEDAQVSAGAPTRGPAACTLRPASACSPCRPHPSDKSGDQSSPVHLFLAGVHGGRRPGAGGAARGLFRAQIWDRALPNKASATARRRPKNALAAGWACTVAAAVRRRAMKAVVIFVVGGVAVYQERGSAMGRG